MNPTRKYRLRWLCWTFLAAVLCFALQGRLPLADWGFCLCAGAMCAGFDLLTE